MNNTQTMRDLVRRWQYADLAQHVSGNGTPSLENRVSEYLRQCPPAVSGDKGHNTTMQVVRAIVWGFDLGPISGFTVLWREYNPRCVPPWSEADLRHKCAEADEKPFGKPRGYLLNAPHPHKANGTVGPPANAGLTAVTTTDEGDWLNHETDQGNAARFVRAYGAEVRYCTAWNKWLAWTGTHWSMDNLGRVEHLSRLSVLADLKAAAAEVTSADCPAQRRLKWALRSGSAERHRAMIFETRSWPEVVIAPALLDTAPWLLNCANGTLDLRTGKIRPHDRADLLTKLCPTVYDPAARAPVWDQFLADLFAGDADVIAYIRRLLGYCLTGDVSEQCLPIFWGSGANGKSTLVNTVMAVLGGDYALQAVPDMLLARRDEKHLTELADLFGKRLAVCAETDEGRSINEARIKSLTGNDSIRARRMREDSWQYLPTHKLILLTNHKPRVKGGDHAAWRRLQLVPFTVVFSTPEEAAALGLTKWTMKDKDMPGLLAKEHAGILAALVRGCLEWQQMGGLHPPASLLAATQEYRGEEDVIGRWLADCCMVSNASGVKIRAADAYASFKRWQENSGETVWTSRTFGDRLGTRFTKTPMRDCTWYFGLMTRANVDQENTQEDDYSSPFGV